MTADAAAIRDALRAIRDPRPILDVDCGHGVALQAWCDLCDDVLRASLDAGRNVHYPDH